MDSFELRFGGVDVLGDRRKDRPGRLVTTFSWGRCRQVPSVRDNHGPQPCLRQNQPSRGSTELCSITHSVTAESSWQLSPGGLNYPAELINGINEAAGNLRLPGQPESFLTSSFFSPSSERDGKVKKRSPHNPAQGYRGRSPRTTLAATTRRIILAHNYNYQQVRHGILHHAET
jgi:hypothetical protein